MVDDETGVKTSAGSGGKSGQGYNSTTGQAVIVGDDPFALNITQVRNNLLTSIIQPVNT